MSSPELNRRINEAERQVHAAARKLTRLRDPKKKLKILWDLAWGSKLRDLEDFRPAGGFGR